MRTARAGSINCARSTSCAWLAAEEARRVTAPHILRFPNGSKEAWAARNRRGFATESSPPWWHQSRHSCSRLPLPCSGCKHLALTTSEKRIKSTEMTGAAPARKRNPLLFDALLTGVRTRGLCSSTAQHAGSLHREKVKNYRNLLKSDVFPTDFTCIM